MSQFTLFGVLKGNKPDFHVAMPPEKAKTFYASVVDKFRKAYNVDAVKGISMLPSFILHLLTCLRKFKLLFCGILFLISLNFLADGVFGAMMKVLLA